MHSCVFLFATVQSRELFWRERCEWNEGDEMVMKKKKRWTRRKRKIVIGLSLFLILYISVTAWHIYKPLPAGISYAGPLHRADDVEMFVDLSYVYDADDEEIQAELSIFDEIYAMIDRAEKFIVLDFFLYDDHFDEEVNFPKLVETMTAKLIRKKEDHPDITIVFITDPINTGYGSYENEWFEQMERAGIDIVYSDLKPLRDSTPIYSGLYRTIFQWLDVEKKGWIPNAMASEAPKMTLASYMTLLNVKANHRKTIVTDQEALVTSGNPHNASGLHGNVALKVKGPVLNDILEAEEAVVAYSTGGTLPRLEVAEQTEGMYAVQYLTEKKILQAMLDDIEKAEEGDTIWLGMFFIAKKELVEALMEAASRGVKVKMILDPNENSFGNEKTGIPNRPVAQEMMEKSGDEMEIRWYNTVIGQYHTKLVVVQTADGTYISNGSANLTERTLDDYNLEANLRVIAPMDSELMQQVEAYFERLWNNEDALYTVEFETYQDSFTFFQRGIIALQHLLNLTTY